MTDQERDRELDAIRETYQRYEREGRYRTWDRRNPGNARIERDRDRALLDLLRRSLPATGGRVLDLGMGDGRLAETVRSADVPIGSWTGVDLDPRAVQAAAAAVPWAHFVEASGDRLPFDQASFDVVIASTLFSSMPSRQLEDGVATEIGRVLDAGCWLIWYDLRYRNPANPSVHGVGRPALRGFFPEWHDELRSITLLPPMARRLGPATGVLYGPLERLPFLRSHLIGRLRRL
ncbi:MAG: class I SAM-dependent methyltransferase [Chloroflexota bacterium]|nr:class I SAM-dependent methyltransferase [Chloroflexota bacterium]